MRNWNIRENERLGWNLVCSLGVIFDSKLSIRSQVSKIASVCFIFYLRRLWQLRGVVTDKVVKHLVTSLVVTLCCTGFRHQLWYPCSVCRSSRTCPLGLALDWITGHTSSLRYGVFTGCLSSSSSSTTVGSMPVGVWRHSYYRCPPLPI